MCVCCGIRRCLSGTRSRLQVDVPRWKKITKYVLQTRAQELELTVTVCVSFICPSFGTFTTGSTTLCVGASTRAVTPAVVAQALVHIYTIDMCQCLCQHITLIDRLILTFAANIADVRIPRWAVAACAATHCVGAFSFAVASAIVAQALVHV